MKKFLPLIIIVLLWLSDQLKAQELNRIWSSESTLQVPESVLFSAYHNCLFVSNIVGNPADKDGVGVISILNQDGSIKELNWVTGLSAPKGMAVDSMYLYVSDIDELVVIDIKLQQIHNRIRRDGARFLNDVTINKKGSVFVSDTQTGRIYKLKDNSLNVWLEGPMLKGVNGLYCHNDDLIVGTENCILKVSMVDQSFEVLIENTTPVDGLVGDDNGGYYFSTWDGLLYHAVPDNTPVLLLDTSSENVNCADIGYDPTSRLIFVPTFFDNRVVAYRWGKL
nr:hypothetical protein [uncultured Carboxylicivirga sp.]